LGVLVAQFSSVFRATLKLFVDSEHILLDPLVKLEFFDVLEKHAKIAKEKKV